MKQVGRRVLLCGSLKTRSLSMHCRIQRGRRLPLVGEGLLAPRLDNTTPVWHEGTALAPCPPKRNKARKIKEASTGTGREARRHNA